MELSSSSAEIQSCNECDGSLLLSRCTHMHTPKRAIKFINKQNNAEITYVCKKCEFKKIKNKKFHDIVCYLELINVSRYGF